MESVIQDLRHEFRALIKDPRFSVMVLISLVLGIGANATVFNWLKAVLVDPLPRVKDVGSLTVLYGLTKDGRPISTSYPDYKDYRDRNNVFSSLITFDLIPVNLSAGGDAERVWGAMVSGNYFSALGVDPFLGRTFTQSDDQTPGAHPVAVISHGLWERYFGADPNVVGRSVKLNGHTFTVIGVTPNGFMGTFVGVPLDIYSPMMMQAQLMPGSDLLNDRGARQFEMIGRLRSGISLEQARAAMSNLARQLEQDHPETDKDMGISLFTLMGSPSGIQGAMMRALLISTLVAGLVLLITCFNIANLLLARALSRNHEIATRLAIGATRGRLIRQLLTESLALGLVGGITSFAVAIWTSNLLTTMIPPIGVPIKFDVSIDWRVLAATVILAALTGIIFGLVPALQSSKVNLVTALKDNAGTVTGDRKKSRLRSALLIGQVAVSVVLLIAAGLLLRSFQKMQEINPGFNPNNALIMSFDLGLQGYDEKRGMSFYRQLLDRAKSLPGVKAASLAMRMPLNARGTSRVPIAIEGRPSAPGEGLAVNYNVVGPDYLEAMGIPLARGRGFTSQDAEGAQPVIMINEHMGKRLWPGEDPIGKRISIGGPNAPYREIVGVVGNGKYYELTEPQIGQLYIPLYQNYESSIVLVTRTEGDPLSRLAAVKNEVNALDKDLPVFDIRTLNDHMRISLLIQRFLTSLLGIFGLLAFTLSAMGTYSVISYNTSQRLREYAIRTALGASPRDILRQIIGGGVRLVAIGLAIGLLVALVLGAFLSSAIYGVASYDPIILISIVLLMTAVAVIASYVPARKALKVDPVKSLRAQ